jgi:F-type H+-transporting ATPase subunit b
MQSLDVISVNIWQIVISLLNLLLLFLVVKKFLFGPVRKILAKRQGEIDVHYDAAKQAELDAQRDRAEWESKLAGADAQAEAILQSATENAQYRSDKIVAEAQERAQSILRVAQNEAELERKKAVDGIKREIVEVSGALAEKMLEREIKADDHRALIDSFIEEIGDGNE